MLTNFQSRTAIIIPAYNEEMAISDLIKKITSYGYRHIYVVDDGSTDQTFSAAARAGALTLRHRINRGKGAATKTALEAAKSQTFTYFVTMDGDGQHDPADISHLLAPVVFGDSEAALGVRQKEKHNMPALRRLANLAADHFVNFAYRIGVSDSQCGFRAFSRLAINHLSTSADRYEFETEVLRELRQHRLRWTEVPVRTIYSPYSQAKTARQDLYNGLVTLYKLLWKSLSF